MPGPLADYRKISRFKMPGLLVGLLALWWLANLISDYQIEPVEGHQTDTALRVAHATWAMAVETEDAPLWVQYLLLYTSSQGAREYCVEMFDALSEKGQLDSHGESARRTMRSFLSGAAPAPSSTMLAQWQSSHEEQYPWSWETESLEQLNPDETPEWVTESITYGKEFNQEIYRHWIAGTGLWVITLLIGLPFIPAALRCFRTRNHLPASPITATWQPNLMLGLMFAVLIMDDWFFALLYEFLAFFGTHYNDYGLLALDAAWRSLGPLVFAIVFLASWKHGGRLLGLDLAPKLKPVLGMMPIVFVYDLAADALCRLAELDDPSELPYLDTDGFSGLLLTISSAVVFAPVMEEILFRGFLFQGLQKRSSFWIATIASTLIFVFIHIYGIYGSISVASFGIVACALYRATGSLWTPILYHALTNGLITASTWPVFNGVYSEW